MPELVLADRTIELDADGHLKNLEDWNESLAAEIAKDEGIETLTEDHWKVINFMRKVFVQTGDAPSIRKLTKESGIDTKTLYKLFPKARQRKRLR